MKKKRLIGIIILILFFIGILVSVLTGTIKSLDDWLYQVLFSLRSPFWDNFFKGFTRFGNTSTIIILVVIVFCFLKKKDRFIFLTSIISTVGTNQIIKHIIRRPRPSHLRLIEETSFSFPSGHAMISIAMYGFLIYYIYREVKNKYLKVSLILLLTLIIIGIGCSRIYLGVHYPSDVIGGYFLALDILIVIITYYNNRGNFYD